MPTLEVKKLSFTYQSSDKPTLKDLSFTIRDGEHTAIIGPSGSGKSTLLSVLASRYVTENGSVKVDNKPIPSPLDLLTRYIDGIYYLEQNEFLPAFTRPSEAFERALRHIPTSDRKSFTIEIARHFGIKSLINTKPESLSLGQKQRIGIALAFTKPKQLILFDEPFSHQDPLNRQKLFVAIKQALKFNQSTLIFTTHQNQEAQILASKGIFINEGRLKAKGSFKSLVKHKSIEVKSFFQFISGKEACYSSSSVFSTGLKEKYPTLSLTLGIDGDENPDWKNQN